MRSTRKKLLILPQLFYFVVFLNSWFVIAKAKNTRAMFRGIIFLYYYVRVVVIVIVVIVVVFLFIAFFVIIWYYLVIKYAIAEN